MKTFTQAAKKRVALFLAVAGPGLVVMLADTDAGSIITAAQSGAVWGYKLLILQFILIPILYIAQELTVRLGLSTGMGHGELIKKHFGSFWAWISVSTLLVCCIGALITELSGLVGVGSLFGIPGYLTMIVVVSFLIVIAWTGNYLSVERIALLLGAFELVFLYVAWKAHPDLKSIVDSFVSLPLHDKSYLYLAAANIGAVIMPWMIFYQQSAVLDKKLDMKVIKMARWDTAIGAVVTQLIMAAVLIAAAATLYTAHANTSLESVADISHALTPFLGETTGRLLFAAGMMGAALVASIVVSLTAAWGLGEVLGYRRSLQDHPREAPWFYGMYTAVLIIGGIIVSTPINLVKLSVAVEVMNALLLPIVLGFLFILAVKALPEEHRLKGWYAYFVGTILSITAVFGVVAGLMGLA
jgi:NRAMP (natural resistance-associated macrophage protein)-like metal ion transporter